MKLLARLRNIFWKISTIDQWEAARGTYVIWYREGFKQLASKLSTDSRTVSMRYNAENKAIELYSTDDGQTIMQFNVHGTMGTPYEAIVISEPLDMEMQDYIIEMFKMKVQSTPQQMRIIFKSFQ